MNPERLKKLQAQAAQVRIGGKGELSDLKKKKCFCCSFVRWSTNFVFVFVSIFRNSTTKEEDRAPNCGHGWQEAAIDIEETRCESNSGHWGSQHDQERRHRHPFQQSSHSSFFELQHIRHHRTYRDQKCKWRRFPRAFCKRLCSGRLFSLF